MHCHHCGSQLHESAKFCTKCGIKVLGSDASTNAPVPQPTGAQIVSKKHKTLGILFIISPFAILILILLAWAIVIFVVAQTGEVTDEGAEIESTTISVIQWLLGFVGMLAVMGIFILVPLGIYFLSKKTIMSNVNFDERSGKGEASIMPAEIQGWSWGAAGLTWIWGVSNNVWISLLTFVPIINIFWWIVLGINGNEWAWKARSWESVEQFRETQRKWGRWGLGLFVFGITVFVGSILLSIIFAEYN